MAYREEMVPQWSDVPPAVLDRRSHTRVHGIPDDAHAVLVGPRGVVADESGVLTYPPDQQPEADLRVYLGRHDGRDYCAVVARREDEWGAKPWMGLRDIISSTPADLDRELAVTATAAAHWHEAHQRCAQCGELTDVAEAGWLRLCPACGRHSYPRTDPAVIVAITDHENRLLLAHGAQWSPRRYSHLAGYVEPGESLEQAVHREVSEESGLLVEHVRYVGSQPWPFPGSVMVGFTARALSTQISVDEVEVTDARFLTRAQVHDAVAAEEIILAPPGSIARAMIDAWLWAVDAPPRVPYS